MGPDTLSTPARAAARRRGAGLAAAMIGALAAPRPGIAEPLWEYGLGVGAIGFADYRGADTSHVYPLPVPYLLYNGEFLKADRDGVRGQLFDQDRVDLSLSANATTPVRNNSARGGMPDLRSTVEIGPSLDLTLLRTEDGRVKIDLRLPLRIAYTVEASPHDIGWDFEPRAAVDLADAFGVPGLKLGLLGGPLFQDRRYDDYFYSVAPRYALPGRPAYQAPGGYAGTQALAALSKRFPAYWVGAYVRFDTLAGAVFDPSPLVLRDRYWSSGVAIVWMLGRSGRDAP